MTRTSRTLRRLGVVGLAAVTIGAGFPALLAAPASAAHVTNVTLTPPVEAGEEGVCNPFTIQVNPAQQTIVDVTISQTTTTGTAADPADTAAEAPLIGFCDVTPLDPNDGPNQQDAPAGTTRTTGGGTVQQLANDPGPDADPTVAECGTGNAFTPGTTASPQGSTTCTAEFETNAAGFVTFGVISFDTEPGVERLNVQAFVEEDNATAAEQGDFNETGNNRRDQGEPQDTSVKFVFEGDPDAFAATIDCTPENADNQLPEDDVHRFTCTAFSDPATTGGTAVPVRDVDIDAEIIAGPNDQGPNQQEPDCGFIDPATNNLVNSRTNNQGQAVCEYVSNGVPGVDTIVGYVDQTDADEPFDEIQKRFIGEARNIACTPREATNPLGTTHTITCTVTDVRGVGVIGQSVQFNASFPGGRFTDSGTFTTVRQTNTNGVVTATLFNPDQNARQTIQARIGEQVGNIFVPDAENQAPLQDDRNECQLGIGTTNSGTNTTANTPTAGNCDDQVVKNWGTGVNPPPASTPPATPTQTQTATPTVTQTVTQTATQTGTPTGPPGVPCTVPATISVNPTTIVAGRNATVTVRATPNSVVQLFAYSRPSTTYRSVRVAEVGADGVAQFVIVPPTNTRMYAQQNGCNASQSIVLNVRTAIGINAVRTGTRTYTFHGGTLPKRPGQIVSLYRVTATGSEVLTGQARTGADGRWVIQRTFTGTGRFGFIARTSQDLINAPGASVVRPTIIF